jgi:hypothetical protein
VPGVSDLVSGFIAFRLITLRHAFRAQEGPLLTAEGWSANAELIARAARVARRVETISAVERHDLRHRPSRVQPWQTAMALWRSRSGLRLPPPAPPPAQPRAERRAPEPVGSEK